MWRVIQFFVVFNAYFIRSARCCAAIRRGQLILKERDGSSTRDTMIPGDVNYTGDGHSEVRFGGRAARG